MKTRAGAALILLFLVALGLYLYNTGRLAAVLRAIAGEGGTGTPLPGAKPVSSVPSDAMNPAPFVASWGGDSAPLPRYDFADYSTMPRVGWDSLGAEGQGAVVDLVKTGRVGQARQQGMKSTATDAGYAALAASGPWGQAAAALGKALGWRL